MENFIEITLLFKIFDNEEQKIYDVIKEAYDETNNDYFEEDKKDFTEEYLSTFDINELQEMCKLAKLKNYYKYRKLN